VIRSQGYDGLRLTLGLEAEDTRRQGRALKLRIWWPAVVWPKAPRGRTGEAFVLSSEGRNVFGDRGEGDCREEGCLKQQGPSEL